MSSEEKSVFEYDLLKLLGEIEDFAFIVFNNEQQILQWNKGAMMLFGWSPREAIGQSVENLLLSELAYSQHKEYLKHAAANSKVIYESIEVKKDNSVFNAQTYLYALYSNSGTVNGYAKIVRDTTRFKLLEEDNNLLKRGLEEKVRLRTQELEIVNKELEAFSYSVSHDLRTPLRAIVGYSIMLKEDYEAELDNEANRLINNIVHHTKMMGQLIDDLLTFSKMARLEVVNKSVDMYMLAISCYNDLKQSENRADTTFHIDTLVTCNGDSNMLRQVWYNLLQNAIKYTAYTQNPHIEVGFIDQPDHHVYFVKDNGVGFDMKYAGKLFGVFQRLHRQDEFEGTGLGLALVKRIISKHGGNIWCQAAVGQGASFFFSIPKKQRHEQ